MASDQKKTLIASILKYLDDEIKENSEKEDCVDFVEGLEVATQCIRSSFDLSTIDYDRVPPLPEVFTAGCKALDCSQVAVKRTVTDADKADAERLKADGNVFISESKYLEAVGAYTKAIDKDPYNAVYYGNRAAAYSKLNDHEAAIRDCERALLHDPAYSKAYGRMGFAYAAQKNHAKAVECYEKALSLEPDNPSYRQNLETARASLPGAAPGGGGGGGPDLASMMGGGGRGGMDLMSLLNNPQMMQMASQMMQSPQVQQMIANMMGGGAGGTGGAGANPFGAGFGAGFGAAATNAAGSGGGEHASAEEGPTDAPAAGEESQEPQQQQQQQPPNLQDLLRMGQQFASQMQAANPDLVQSLRQEYQQGEQGSDGQGGQGGQGGGRNPGDGDEDGSKEGGGSGKPTYFS